MEKKEWSRDWSQFDWEDVRQKLAKISIPEEGKRKEHPGEIPDIGITLEELVEYLQWLNLEDPEEYWKKMMTLKLWESGMGLENAEYWAERPEEMKKILDQFGNRNQ